MRRESNEDEDEDEEKEDEDWGRKRRKRKWRFGLDFPERAKEVGMLLRLCELGI